MSFPYNNSSPNPRQMFPASSQAHTQVPVGAVNMMHQTGMQGQGMQRYPTPMYGNQAGYMQQPYQGQPQGFQQGFASYHRGTHPRPGMQMPSQMVTHQQMLEQQKRMAEKQQKQNEEMMKKKNFEVQQRKLQAFKGKAGAKSNPLNELFGKKDGKSDTSDLIGSLGSRSTQKSFAKTSIFSRPGGSLSHSQMSSTSHMLRSPGPVPSQAVSGNNTQHLLSRGVPGQGGQFSPNTYSAEMTADSAGKANDFGEFKGNTGQGFGNFASGPDSEFGKFQSTLAGQMGSDDVFSGFQEAKSMFPEARMGVSSTGSAPLSSQGIHPFGFLSQSTGRPSGLQECITGSTSSTLSGGGRERTDSFPRMPHDQQTVSNFPSAANSTTLAIGGIHEVVKQRTSSLSGVPQVPVQPTTGLSGPAGNRTSSFSGQPGVSAISAPFTGNNTARPSIHGNLLTAQSTSAGYAQSSTQGFGHSMQGSGYGNSLVTGSVPFGHGSGGSLSHQAVPGTNMPHSPVVMPPGGSTMSKVNTSASGCAHAVASAISASDDASSGVPTPEEDKTEPEEDPLKTLYGVDLPDWVISGTDLPGVYKDVVAKCTCGPDMIDTNVLYPILLYSDLPRDTLGVIWNKANQATPGQLNHLELRILLGLVALAQAGIKAERLTLEKLTSCKAAPIPTFPEDILVKKKEDGWSFSEQQSIEGTNQSSRHDSDRGSTSSLASSTSGSAVDPNDRYSAFRIQEHPAAFPGTAVSSGMAPPTKDISPSLTVPGGNPTQPHNTQWNLPSGEVSTTQPRNTQWNLPSGGWQSPNKNLNTSFASTPAPDDFGSFQSTIPQSTGEEDFGDFGDFKSGAADDIFSSTSAGLPPVVGPVSTASGHPQVPTMSSALISPIAAPVATTTTDSSASNLSDSSAFQQQPGKATEADFEAFLDSNVPSRTTLKDLALQFNTLGSGTAAPNKQEERSGNQKETKHSNVADLLSGVSMKKGGDPEASSNKMSISALYSPTPTLHVGSGQNHHLPLKDTNEATDDKYDIFRTLSLEDQKSVFDTTAQVGQTEAFAPNAQTNDGSFGEFEEFQGHAQKVGPGADDFENFSDFKSKSLPQTKKTSDLFGDFSSFSQPSQMVTSEDFGDFQDVTKNTAHTQPVGLEFGSHTFGDFHTQKTNTSDFGSFSASIADTNKSTGSSDVWNLNTFEQKAVDAKSENGNFASFGSFASAPATEGSGFAKHKAIADISSVPLEPSQRYKALSAEFEDVDKHVSVWGRCLNSCLLTMTTTSFLIQKMIADSVQEEILKSKEGSKYFAAVVEVYRVTKRIRASIQKSAPNNAKLKDILEETERTWKNIANVLSGSDIMPQISSLDFSASHVSSEEDSSLACGVCLLNVNKTSPGASKHACAHLMHAGRQYHTTCANFWCNRVDSVLPSLLPICGLL